MGVSSFSELEALVRERVKTPRRALVVGNCSMLLLHALEKSRRAGLIAPTLAGSSQTMRDLASTHGIDLSGFEMREADHDPAGAAIDALKAQSVDLIVRGNVGVRELLSALFQRDSGFRIGKSFVSGISLHYVAQLGRLLFVTDPVVVPAPSLTDKIAMIENAVRFARKLGFDRPKVAVTAAVEVVYPVMQHTVEAAAISKMNQRGQIRDCIVEGPLSMDTAVIESAAKEKGVTGEVAGHADILVQPTIETSYGMLKAFALYVGAPSGCVVVGGKVPICMTSRSDNSETHHNSILMSIV
jgi:phosphate butyryltransferase